jgi:hypothetical protein
MSFGFAPEVEIALPPGKAIWFKVSGPLLSGRAHQISHRVKGDVVVTICGYRGHRVSPAELGLDRCPECLY